MTFNDNWRQAEAWLMLFCRGSLGERSCPRSATASHSVVVDRNFQLRGGHSTTETIVTTPNSEERGRVISASNLQHYLRTWWTVEYAWLWLSSIVMTQSVISIVACCHSLKLCILAVWALWLQQYYVLKAFLSMWQSGLWKDKMPFQRSLQKVENHETLFSRYKILQFAPNTN